ncbi:MAG: hypothetical protein AAF799_26390 [Myxococcota bacterium]
MSHPKIHRAPPRNGHFEVLVLKAVQREAASGRLLVFALDGDTSKDADALSQFESTWTSTTSDVILGRGKVDAAAAGLQVVATQSRSDGTEGRSAPYRLGGLPT